MHVDGYNKSRRPKNKGREGVKQDMNVKHVNLEMTSEEKYIYPHKTG